MHGNVLAGPLQPSHPMLEDSLHPFDIDPSHLTHRSIWKVVWSCTTTLFACSWVAVHPNIPPASSSNLKIFFKRLEIMACMLIVPELVIVWAARQYYAARYITKEHQAQGWTITHGFFATMGGFVLYDNDVPIKVLGIEDLEQLESDGKIDWPTISEKDIQDKSKRDFVSKGVAVLQTTWFIVQCVPRGLIGLDFTELELGTLASAVLNIILYILWWDKPMAVARPIPVYLRHPTTSEKLPSSPAQHDPSESALARFRKGFKDRGLFMLIDIFIVKPFNFIVKPFDLIHWHNCAVAMFRCDTIPKNPPQLSVPTFYAPKSPKTKTAACIGLFVSILFGGIQCIAWSFSQFPSVTEKLLWTSCAVFITVAPLILFTLVMQPEDSALEKFHVLKPLKMFLIILYWVARIVLFILSLIALRSLPPGLLLQVDWSSYMPHT